MYAIVSNTVSKTSNFLTAFGLVKQTMHPALAKSILLAGAQQRAAMRNLTALRTDTALLKCY